MRLKLLLLLLLPVSASAQEMLISAPVPDKVVTKRNFNRYDYALYAGVVLYRTGDYFTTEKVMDNGGSEVELPNSFVATHAGFAAFSAGMAALEIGGSAYLHWHGHAKLARVLDAISVGTGIATDVSNLYQLNKMLR